MNDDNKTKLNAEKIREIIGLNFDSRHFFFTTIDEKWFEWLWKNGFLDEIKKKPEEGDRYAYRLPELEYLGRIAEKIPSKFVDFVLSFSISESTTNPGVIDRFVWIAQKLPAEELARLVPKIESENWIRLTGPFINDWGFEYEKMLGTLLRAKKYDEVISLASVIFTVREGENSGQRMNFDNPFYFNGLQYTKVFEYLIGVDQAHWESALALTVNVLSKLVLLGGKSNEKSIFAINEIFYLFEVDFFTLEPGQQKEPYSHRDEVRELTATVKFFAKKLIEDTENDGAARDIYKKYILPLPDSGAMWRLKASILALRPEAFKEEVKKEILRVFDYETPGDLLSGTEYERLLAAGFYLLTNAEQRDYVSKIITWFAKSRWPESGKDILSAIFKFLTPEEKTLAEQAFGPLVENYEPRTAAGPMMSGYIAARAPGGEEDWKGPIPEIVKKLKSDWSPLSLAKDEKNLEDFFRPIDGEGVGERLKTEIGMRPQEFLDHAELFFDRGNLDSHYTYTFLNAFYTLIREGKIGKELEFSKIIALMKAVMESGSKTPLKERDLEKRTRSWLGHWDAVHNSMGDLVKSFLGDGSSDKVMLDFNKYRKDFFELISYLLTYRDPAPKDEELETAKSTTRPAGAQDSMVSNPFTMAINSVRGRAFQAFVIFIFLDNRSEGKKISELSQDSEKLYEDVLTKERTRAIFFMYGHYLPHFYFRDRKWLLNLLPQIFPTDESKKHLYIAAWEGYLAGNLYEELFFEADVQKLYERGILLKDPRDKNRQNFRDPDEGLAGHLALAFVYYEKFGFDHHLFKMFWSIPSEKQGEFVNYLGRLFISGSNAQADELIQKEPRAKQRLREFWDWILAKDFGVEIFDGFGFWVNLEKDIFDYAWLAGHLRKTLEKTNGVLSWNFGLSRSIVRLAQAAPKDALEIVRLHILEAGVRRKSTRITPIYLDSEWIEAFKILYADATTKAGTGSLISLLLKEGGSPFWSLEEILK
jgi:hypothetical protein